MHLTFADAILLGVLTIVTPVYSYFAGRRIERGELPQRVYVYVRGMVTWWLLAGITLYLWTRLGRPIPALGLNIPIDFRALGGAIPCLAVIVHMSLTRRALAMLPPERLAAIRERFGRTAAILPSTPGEYRWFLALSLTAGICEELLFRGYFFAVTAPYVTVFGSLVISAAIFGIGHLYQGWRGVLQTALVGLALGAIYLLTGTLFWPMLLHFLIDVRGGTMGYTVMRRAQSTPATS